MGGTAQFSAARPYTAYPSGFLARTYLAHFNPYPEFLGKDLNKLAEIDSFISNIVENCFCFISLILNISDLHVQFELL
jgi:hypothetical protein